MAYNGCEIDFSLRNLDGYLRILEIYNDNEIDDYCLSIDVDGICNDIPLKYINKKYFEDYAETLKEEIHDKLFYMPEYDIQEEIERTKLINRIKELALGNNFIIDDINLYGYGNIVNKINNNGIELKNKHYKFGSYFLDWIYIDTESLKKILNIIDK